jgi:hypothetical protein
VALQQYLRSHPRPARQIPWPANQNWVRWLEAWGTAQPDDARRLDALSGAILGCYGP